MRREPDRATAEKERKNRCTISDNGGDRAAILYSLIESCKLNGIDPQRYLHYVLERIADHPINRVHELLPWNVVNQLNQPAAVSEAMAA